MSSEVRAVARSVQQVQRARTRGDGDRRGTYMQTNIDSLSQLNDLRDFKSRQTRSQRVQSYMNRREAANVPLPSDFDVMMDEAITYPPLPYVAHDEL